MVTLAQAWIEADRSWSTGTQRTYWSVVNKQVKPAFGQLCIREVTPGVVSRAMYAIAKSSGPGAAKTARACLSGMFALAIQDGWPPSTWARRRAPTGSSFGAIGLGAALGPTLLLRLTPDPRRPLYVFDHYVLRGLVDLVLASVRSLPVAAATLAVYGLGTSTGAVTFNSLLQSHVTDRTRGRVFSLVDELWQTGRLASPGVGGLLADTLGIRAVYYIGGVLLLLAAATGFAASRPTGPVAAGGEARIGED